MARTDANLTIMILVREFLPEYWPGWTDAEKAMLSDSKAMGDIIKKRLENGGCEIAEMYGIIYSKDDKHLWDEYQMIYKLGFKLPHIHIVIKFKPKKGKTLGLELIGVKSNFIEPPKAGRYSYDNMLAYLIHIKYHKKYQYDSHDVITFAGKDYMEYYREKYEAWMNGRAQLLVNNTKADLNTLKTRIVEDENFTVDDGVLDANYSKVYMMYHARVDKVFESRKRVEALRQRAEEKRRKETEKKEIINFI